MSALAQDAVDDDTETTPLLAAGREHDARPSNSKPTWFIPSSSISPKTGILILLSFTPFIHLAYTIPTTTTLDLVQRFLCHYWYVFNDPSKTANAPIVHDDPRCHIPGVNSWFSAMIMFLAIATGIGAFITYSVIGRKAGVWGRKPILVFLLIVESFGTFLLPLSDLVSYEPIVIIMQLIWIFKGTVSSIYTTILLSSLMVVDTVESASRTQWLLLLAGVGSLGRTPAFMIGGLITSKTGNPIIIYYLSGGLTLLMTICVVLFIPETFGEEKREQVKREQEAERHLHRTDGFSLRQIWFTVLVPFRQLGELLPLKDQKTGKRKTRLFLLSCGFFLGTFVGSYIGQALITYSVAKFLFTAEENGYLLTSLSAATTIWTLALSPLLLKFLERFYSQPASTTSSIPPRSPVMEGGEVQPESQPQTPIKSKTFARRDVHVAAGSYFLEAVALTLTGSAQTGLQLTVAASLWGCSGSSGSAVRSAVAASVPPIKHGEVFAALEMLSSAAMLIGPLQGVLLTILINTAPQLVFFLCAGITLLGGTLILFAKDSERYVEPWEED